MSQKSVEFSTHLTQIKFCVRIFVASVGLLSNFRHLNVTLTLGGDIENAIHYGSVYLPRHHATASVHFHNKAVEILMFKIFHFTLLGFWRASISHLLMEIRINSSHKSSFLILFLYQYYVRTFVIPKRFC